MYEQQRTLKKEVSLTGAGLHTGSHTTITFKPAPVNHGYKFCRTDLPDRPIIDAIADNVNDTSRGTNLLQNGVGISTVEHALSALYGMSIDNALIEIDGPEVPIMGGAAVAFVNAFKSVGIVEQDAPRQYYSVKEPITYTDSARDIELTIYPDDHFSLTVLIDYNSKILGNQYASLDSLSDYESQICSCRTFVFFHEMEPLFKMGLIKGGDIQNALVILEKEVPQEEWERLELLLNKKESFTNKPGIINNQLRFSNEPARHKLLDLIGDLALVGMPIKGRVIAMRPGHKSNTALSALIRQEMRHSILKTKIPTYNPNKEPLYNIEQIKKLIPHREPFLLVDKIIEISDNSIIGIKNVTYGEEFLSGHFPKEPLMPGVLIIEAMAQCGAILVSHDKEKPEDYSSYMIRIEKVKMRHKVVPGDTLIIKVEIRKTMKKGIICMYGQVFVGKQMVVEGEIYAQTNRSKINKTN